MKQQRYSPAVLIVIAAVVIGCGAAQPGSQPETSVPQQPTREPTAIAAPTSGSQLDVGGNWEAQQASGQAAYGRSCERCHGASLEDGFAAKLSRAALGKYGTALELYEFLRSAMPKGNAGSLPDQEYYDITAYLLAKQGQLTEGQVVGADSAAGIQLAE